MFLSLNWFLSTPTLWIWLYFWMSRCYGPGIGSRWDEIFPTDPDRPWGPTQPPVQWVLCFFTGDKAACAWRQPTATSAGVKWRVELYLYCPSGASWSVFRLTLPFILLNGEEKIVMCSCSYSYNACVLCLSCIFAKLLDLKTRSSVITKCIRPIQVCACTVGLEVFVQVLLTSHFADR